jgi:hypothetical protein
MLWPLSFGNVMVRAKMNPRMASPQPMEQRNVSRVEIARLLLTSFLPLAVMIAVVLGSIVAGWATAGEAAAPGAIGAIILALSCAALVAGFGTATTPGTRASSCSSTHGGCCLRRGVPSRGNSWVGLQSDEAGAGPAVSGMTRTLDNSA